MKKFYVKFLIILAATILAIFAIAFLPDVGRHLFKTNVDKEVKKVENTIESTPVLNKIAKSLEEKVDKNDSKKDSADVSTEFNMISPASEEHITYQMEYLYAVDGDTIVVKNKEGEEITVRMIGINTEESVASEEYEEKSGKQNNKYGKMASEYTKELLSSSTHVYLEYDEEYYDDYGRTLAYVWLSDDTYDIKNCVNAILVNEGYAETLKFEPNIKYSTTFETMQEDAKNAHRGLWYYEGYREMKLNQEE